MRPSRIAAVAFLAASVGALAGIATAEETKNATPASPDNTQWTQPALIAAISPPPGVTVSGNIELDKATLDAIAAALLADIDVAEEIGNGLLDSLVVDAMSLKLAVDEQRYHDEQARRAASRAKRAAAKQDAWWLLQGDRPAPQHLTSPSSLWLIIPGALLIAGGGALRRRYKRRHSNATPPILARRGRSWRC